MIIFRQTFGIKLGLVLTGGLKCGLSKVTMVKAVVMGHPPGGEKAVRN